MPMIPPLPMPNPRGRGRGRGHGQRGGAQPVGLPLQANMLMDLDDPFGPPMPEIPEPQHQVVNLDDDLPLAPIPAPVPMPAPMHMEDINGLGIAAHNPARIVGGVRHNIPRMASGRHTARQPHPTNPNKLWCTHNSHWVLEVDFGELRTCEECCRKQRARGEQERAQAAQAMVQMQLQDQINDPV